MKLKRILVPTDFSDYSLQALGHAIDLAKQFNARIIVFHSVDPIYLAAPADLYGPSGNLSMLMDEQRRSAKEQLARLGRSLQKRRVAVQTVLANGVPHVVIVDAAAKLGADLIVMSTHGRSGLSHLFLGSVAERIVRSATCPVLTVRAAAGARRSGARKRRKQS